MRVCVLITLVVAFMGTAAGQGALSDIMAGSLVNPEVGVYAWYELKDAETGQRFFMRQAIVGRKQVAGKTGYYLETEVMPEVGFPIVYRMLLTGPASSPANVHEIMVKEGVDPAESLPLDILRQEDDDKADVKRESKGVSALDTPDGAVEAEHFLITRGDVAMEVWVNDDIRPMGIVKMVSAEGELLLTRHGKGGPDAESAIDRKSAHGDTNDVTVRVSPGPTKNFSGRTGAN